jgi:hypothetical protein
VRRGDRDSSRGHGDRHGQATGRWRKSRVGSDSDGRVGRDDGRRKESQRSMRDDDDDDDDDNDNDHADDDDDDSADDGRRRKSDRHRGRELAGRRDKRKPRSRDTSDSDSPSYTGEQEREATSRASSNKKSRAGRSRRGSDGDSDEEMSGSHSEGSVPVRRGARSNNDATRRKQRSRGPEVRRHAEQGDSSGDVGASGYEGDSLGAGQPGGAGGDDEFAWDNGDFKYNEEEEIEEIERPGEGGAIITKVRRLQCGRASFCVDVCMCVCEVTT